MQFDFLDSFLNTFFTFFIIIVVIFVIVFAVVFTQICKAGSRISQGGWVVEAPSFVVPSTRTRSDGSQMKTVRLPDRCPSCNASLSHEGIDWVGPMEAKCNYCGGTVKAKFEGV